MRNSSRNSGCAAAAVAHRCTHFFLATLWKSSPLNWLIWKTFSNGERRNWRVSTVSRLFVFHWGSHIPFFFFFFSSPLELLLEQIIFYYCFKIVALRGGVWETLKSPHVSCSCSRVHLSFNSSWRIKILIMPDVESAPWNYHWTWNAAV